MGFHFNPTRFRALINRFLSSGWYSLKLLRMQSATEKSAGRGIKLEAQGHAARYVHMQLILFQVDLKRDVCTVYHGCVNESWVVEGIFYKNFMKNQKS